MRSQLLEPESLGHLQRLHPDLDRLVEVVGQHAVPSDLSEHDGLRP
jgi:hypothetical protein